MSETTANYYSGSLKDGVSYLKGQMKKVVINAELNSIKNCSRRDICELQHRRRQRQR